MKRVDLLPVYGWRCPDCQQVNFGVFNPAEGLTDEDMQELREDHGIEPWQSGDWLKSPLHVVCTHCLNKFETILEGDDDDDEDEL